jgi:hypothetical protein
VDGHQEPAGETGSFWCAVVDTGLAAIRITIRTPIAHHRRSHDIALGYSDAR